MGSKLYVGNLSFDTTEESLRAAFEADGRNVSEVAIISDRMTGRPRGFAFVTMGSSEDAQKAVEALDGRELDGRTLRVSEARERTEGGPRGGGGGGGGGFGGERGGGGGGGERGGGGGGGDRGGGAGGRGGPGGGGGRGGPGGGGGRGGRGGGGGGGRGGSGGGGDRGRY